MNIIAILALTINVVMCVKNFSTGLGLYLILALIFPNIHLGEYIVSYEIFAFTLILFLFLLHRKKYYISDIYVLILMYIMLLFISTFLSLIIYNIEIQWLGLFGHIRFFLILFMVSQILKKSAFENILLVVIGINLFVGLVQLSFPHTAEFFCKLYYKESLTPLLTVLEYGYFPRAYGTFGSPINLGVLSLIAMAYFYAKILSGNMKFLSVAGLIMAVVSGLLSSTKTFILGVPLIFFFGIVFMSKKLFNTKKVLTLLGIGATVTFFGFVAKNVAERLGVPIFWYLSFLLRPADALYGRYNQQEGNLISTINLFKENLFIGVGQTSILGETIGDSAYVGMLHDTGLFGGCLFIIIFALIYRKMLREQDLAGILMLIALLISGIAISPIIHIFGAIILGYAISKKPSVDLTGSEIAAFGDKTGTLKAKEI